MKLQLKIKYSKRIITMSKQQFLMTTITMSKQQFLITTITTSKQQFLIPFDFALFYQVLIMLAAEYYRSRKMWLLVTFYGTKTTNRVLKSLENMYIFFGISSYRGSYKITVVCLTVCLSVSLFVCPSVSSAFFSEMAQ